MDLLDRITISPEIRFGKPCVCGTRLTHEDVLACMSFAAEGHFASKNTARSA